ncbi:MAG TPA: glycosyltransferase family 39 protein [Candidatus Binataceae bacterium]|nr:glycosyltransferase family 39 protein [Candidatus Binataceae bacterium]
MRAAEESRRLALTLLAAAIILGGALRFFHLGASDLAPDEAASWAAAAAPGVAEVVRRQAVLNPGKLAAYELLLHGWIGLFGSGVLAMRTLSALLGIVAIVLIYWTAGEVLALDEQHEQAIDSTDYAAAVTALIAAVSLTMVRYTREARMYPLLMVAALAQTALVLRSHRRGGLANYAGVSLFTALSIAANFSAIFLVAAQGLWLLLSREGRRYGWAWKPLAALAAGVIVLLPFFGVAIANSAVALHQGDLNWISPPAWWSPFSFFNRGTGTLPFPLLLMLAAWGVIAQWRRLRDALVFALFWMYGPVLLLFVMSLAVTPLLVERYALSSFVPFFFLAALGISNIPSAPIRAGALALAVLLSFAHTAAFLIKPPSRQWTHAVAHIQTYSSAATIVVAPPHGANLLRYYLPPEGRYVASEFTPDACARSELLLLWDHALEEPGGKQVDKCLASFHRVLFSEKDVRILIR